MKIQTRFRRLSWRMRSGALGFYALGAHRALETLARATPRSTTLRPRGRHSRLLAMSVVAVPALLIGAESARNARNGSLLPDAGIAITEVASLRGSLERYYAGHNDDGSLNGREIAVTVIVSGYTSRACETDSTPFVTAANTATRRGVLALSRDLIRRYTPGAPFEFGDVVHLHGIGDFVVEDSMNERYQRHADIWFESLPEAREFGRRRAVLTGPYGPVDDLRRVAEVAAGRGKAAP
jgi:3D (Asp-Asp-Asp) domain-containing protein